MAEKTIAQLVTPAPDLTGVTKPQGTELTPAQQKAADEVLAHFSKEGYELSSVKDGDKTLKEEEKFWLVCTGFWIPGETEMMTSLFVLIDI